MENEEKVVNEEKVDFEVNEEKVNEPTINESDIEVQFDDSLLDKPHKMKKEIKKLTKDNLELTKEVEQLTKKVEELDKEVAVTKNAYYKAYADADNMKKRLLAENEKANKYRIQSFALEVLPSIDALELALNGKDPEDPFVKGVQLTYNKLKHALELEGVVEIDCLNKEFDANVANAIATEQVENVQPNIVVEVFQKGYMLKDRLLRAALVKVSE